MNVEKNWFLRFIQSQRGQYVVQVAIVAIGYALGARLAFSIQGVSPFGSSVWPPAGIAQAGLLLFGKRVWPGIFLGILLFNIINPLEKIFLVWLGGTAGAILQAVFGVILLRRLGFSSSLERLNDVVKLVIFGGIISTQISCTVGAFSIYLAGKIPWSQYWSVRWNWWLGDAMAVLILTPLILILIRPAPNQIYTLQIKHKKYQEFLQIFLLTLLILVLSWMVFGSKNEASISRYPLEYLPFPLIIWAAIQFGQRGAVLAAFTVSSIAILGASQGRGPFITKAENISQAILFLQTFMGVITITSLLLAATVSERTAAENSLRQSEIKYRELVENANSIILKVDARGNIIFFNEFAQNFFGYTEAEIIGKNAVGTIIPENDTAGNDLIKMMKNILENPEKYTYNENENTRANGDRVWVGWSNKPLFDADQKFTGILGIGTDITARRNAEIALQKLNEELEIRVAKRTQELEYQREQSERLLLNILPAEIADRLKRGATTIADTFNEVTVLFADIVGFTQISSQIYPSELVCLLNDIFSAFDQLAEKYKLEKIKTIGDAYMVVGGLPIARSDHAQAIADMALEMQQVITQFSTKDGQVFQLRIGINSGPVVAGVIGIKKFIYDLWGDTVNIASRMEAQGLPGNIQVTESTYQQLENHYLFEKRGLIQVKGKGEMTTYFLTARK